MEVIRNTAVDVGTSVKSIYDSTKVGMKSRKKFSVEPGLSVFCAENDMIV